jgi:hypothetical protein
MVGSLERDARPRHYDSGKDYCVEEAMTGKQMEICAVQGEDLKFLLEGDKQRMLDTAKKAAHRLELSRNPCNWMEKLFRVDRCRI